MLAIRLPASIEKRLARLAKVTGRTKTFYAREAILRHLEDLEDLHKAERVLGRIRAGKERTISLDEVIKRYDVEG
jgi:RHH-type transcriptional regulator, rel operon repressor / antitoxin RelB